MIESNIDELIAQLEGIQKAVREGVQDFVSHPERMLEPLKKTAEFAIDDIPPEHRGDTRRLAEAAPEILRHMKAETNGKNEVKFSLRAIPAEAFQLDGEPPSDVWGFQDEIESWIRGGFKELKSDRIIHKLDENGKPYIEYEDEIKGFNEGGEEWIRQKARSLMAIVANHPETFLDSENPKGLGQFIGLTRLSNETATKWSGAIESHWKAWMDEGAEAHLGLALNKSLAKLGITIEI